MDPQLPWWQQTTVYQVYPRSFADSNGDGIGDLRGIIRHLDHLQRLGVETLWFSPFFSSPQVDFGYDISDHHGIAPEYGTAADCDELIREVHARGMRVVFDMVLNHTSDQHPWFQESRASTTSPKRDWYIWREGRGRGGRRPPNNWKSMLGGSGWHRDAGTGQWYWATFLPFQPDLNWRHPDVKRTMLDVVRHWLGRGVDGLRLDIFNALFKDPSFADNPFSWRVVPSEENPDGFFQHNLHTINHPDSVEFARELRRACDAFTDSPRFLVGEVFGPAEVLRRYCGGGDGLNLVFLFKTLRTPFTAEAWRELVQEFERNFPAPLIPTWTFGNHDRSRLLGRVGGDVHKAALVAAWQLTARGVPFIYYGEEIGLTDLEVPREAAQDAMARRLAWVPGWLERWGRTQGVIINRDNCRGPMRWTAEENAGFSPPGVTTWLPISRDSRGADVATQERDPASLLACYRRFLALRRRHPALHAGRLDVVEAPTGVLAYRRRHGSDEVRVFLNVSAQRVQVATGSGQVHTTRGDRVENVTQERWMEPWEGIAVTAGGAS